ncbi:MAG: PorV/PorQ family protein [candidate division WOR-3 bacterium]
MKRAISAILILSGVLAAQQFAKVGQAGAKFLTIPISPRAVGMGETYVSVANDPYTVFINPAGIANVKTRAIATTMLPYWVDTYVGGLAFVAPGKAGNYGIFLGGLMSTGFQEWRLEENGDITQGDEFSYTAMQMGVSYAQYFTDKFSFGLNIKGVYEGFGPYASAWTFATDVGTYYKTGFRDLTLAMSMQNFGPDLKPSGTYIRWTYEQGAIKGDSSAEFSPYPLPLLFRVGMSMSLWKTEYQGLLLAAEITHPNDYVESYAIGMEYNLFNMLYLRAGNKFMFQEAENAPPSGGFSGGVGISFFRGAVDYSFSDMGGLPDLHRIGLSVSF